LGLPTHLVWGWLRAGTLIAGIGIMTMDKLWLAAGLILIGEMIDRGEFYQEMEITTPNSLLQDELEARPEANLIIR